MLECHADIAHRLHGKVAACDLSLPVSVINSTVRDPHDRVFLARCINFAAPEDIYCGDFRSGCNSNQFS